MVLKREVVERRLEELDVILEELAKHCGVDPEAYARDLSLDIDPDEVLLHLDRAFEVLPAFAREVMDWLEEVPDPIPDRPRRPTSDAAVFRHANDRES